MKKVISVLLVLCAALALTACGGAGKQSSTPAAGSVASVLEQQTAATPTPARTPIPMPEIPKPPELPPVEVDLTKLSGNMLYSEVYNIITNKDDYIGKSMRMRGRFALYQAVDENGAPIPGEQYYACVIADAAACCQQGLEFILGDGAVYPEDYPGLGKEFIVSGEFQTYYDGNDRYGHLVNAVLEWEP